MILGCYNLFTLIIAEIFSAFAFSLKDISDLSLISESIPPTSKKSEIFAKLTSKGLSGYYVLNSFSLIISGFIFNINGYLPIVISLILVIVSFLISCLFIEPLSSAEIKNRKDKEKQMNKKEIAISDLKVALNDFKDYFKYIVTSKRLRALILFSSVMYGLITVMVTYQVSLLEELSVSASIIGIIFAVLEIISSIFSKKQAKFHNKFRNKSLMVLGFLASFSCLLAGLAGYISSNLYIIVGIIVFALAIKYAVVGIYHILIDKYFRNFTDENIDSKVFSAKMFFNSISSALLGIIASILLEFTSTKNSLIIISLIFIFLFILALTYMKSRVGLKPKEYSKEELKFSDINTTVSNK